MDVYQENGYESRKDYLTCMAEDYGVHVKTVFALAAMLGATEDFNAIDDTIEPCYAAKIERERVK